MGADLALAPDLLARNSRPNASGPGRLLYYQNKPSGVRCSLGGLLPVWPDSRSTYFI